MWLFARLLLIIIVIADGAVVAIVVVIAVITMNIFMKNVIIICVASYPTFSHAVTLKTTYSLKKRSSFWEVTRPLFNNSRNSGVGETGGQHVFHKERPLFAVTNSLPVFQSRGYYIQKHKQSPLTLYFIFVRLDLLCFRFCDSFAVSISWPSPLDCELYN